jgi:hypothetical protein
MPVISQTVGTVICLTLGIGSTLALLAWGIAEWRRRDRCQLLVLLAGSLIGFLTSTGLDLVANAELPPPISVSPVIYRLFGLHETHWTLTVYPVFLALPAYLAFLALTEQWSRRAFWLTALILTAFNFAGELFMVGMAHLYRYAGQQPLLVCGASLMWDTVYVTENMLMGALLYFLGSRLHGTAWLLTLPIIGSGFMGFMVVVGWPGMIAIHAEVSRAAVPALGVATLACCAAVLHMISLHLNQPASSAGRPGA